MGSAAVRSPVTSCCRSHCVAGEIVPSKGSCCRRHGVAGGIVSLVTLCRRNACVARLPGMLQSSPGFVGRYGRSLWWGDELGRRGRSAVHRSGRLRSVPVIRLPARGVPAFRAFRAFREHYARWPRPFPGTRAGIPGIAPGNPGTPPRRADSRRRHLPPKSLVREQVGRRVKTGRPDAGRPERMHGPDGPCCSRCAGRRNGTGPDHHR